MNNYPKPKMDYGYSPGMREAWKKGLLFLRGYPKFLYDAIISRSDEAGEKFIEQKFIKDLETRKINLINKIEQKVGKINEININRNVKGGFDGVVKGEKGTATVETIGEGGYNIQRFHYRSLVK